MTVASALVTGASGFVGRSLVEHLCASGWKITVLGRNGSRLPESTSTVLIDRWDAETVRTALADREFDVLFHLAAYGVHPEQRDAETMARFNILATGSLVAAAAACGARAVVYTGSCSEYQASDSGKPIVEDQAFAQHNLYGVSKAAAGLWGRAAARNLGIRFCWLRLFGIYGPGEAPHRLIPYIAGHLRNARRVDLTAGEQVRDLMFVEDVVTALVLASGAAIEGHEGPFNVCTGEGTTIRAVAGMVADVMKAPHALLDFGRRPYRPDEPMWLVGCPARFREATGFLPKVDLRTGIARALEFATDPPLPR